MSMRRRGPEFERSKGQRVVIGSYENPTAPEPSGPAPRTLLGRLRDRFEGRKIRQGPGFQAPPDTERIGRHRPQKSSTKKFPRQRPDFNDPTG